MRDIDRFKQRLQQAVKPTFDCLARLAERAPSMKPALTVLSDRLFDPGCGEAALAEDAGCSVDELRATFKQETGLTPEELIREHRMEVAARMLVNVKLTEEEAGHLVGVPDTESFREDFVIWSKGFGPEDFRNRVRDQMARVGPLPESGLSWSYLDRVARSGMTEEETEWLAEYLQLLYLHAAAASPEEKVPDGLTRQFLEEKHAGPWGEQMRDDILMAPHFFDYLSDKVREMGRHDRKRAAELAETVVKSLMSLAEVRGKVDFERVTLAWARLAYQRFMAGELGVAEAAFEIAASESYYFLPKGEDRDRRLEGERWYLEARLRWFQRRFDEARALLNQAVKTLRRTDSTLLARALLLRVGLDSHNPSRTRKLLDDLRDARELLDAENYPNEMLELNDLWLDVAETWGEVDAVIDALPAIRELGERLGHEETVYRCMWFESLVICDWEDIDEDRPKWLQARAGFADLGLPELNVEIEMELMALCSDQERYAEALDWARALLESLENLDIHPDTLPARKALLGAVTSRQLPVEIFTQARDAVRVVKRELKARRGPLFEL